MKSETASPKGGSKDTKIEPRRERKRRQDRESQRMSRIRTKEYIEHLETLVHSLIAVNLDEKMANMRKLLDETFGENQRLRARLATVRRIAGEDEEQLTKPEDASDRSALTPVSRVDSTSGERHDASSSPETPATVAGVPLSYKTSQKVDMISPDYTIFMDRTSNYCSCAANNSTLDTTSNMYSLPEVDFLSQGEIDNLFKGALDFECHHV
ncbi:hypothetical protein H2204_002597 [Knufia peltigerae]|uniref:BZIP domain-containing protein n=1 Tax=Knufia peltigerae TaxID=1002370 RepID=A0AA38YB17_9EURO|nr:hypothetical protein H2204_002597 [Knufia peltigerae]